jgi:hypothetical protein
VNRLYYPNLIFRTFCLPSKMSVDRNPRLRR